jgi:hypothetical protein
MDSTTLTEQQVALINEMTRVRPVLEPALDYGGNTHDYIDIVNGVVTGQFHLWPTANSALITEFHNYPNKKFLHIFLAGGDLEEIKGNHDIVVEFAKTMGCNGLTLTGRPGWIKALADLGFGTDGLRYVTKEFTS